MENKSTESNSLSQDELQFEITRLKNELSEVYETCAKIADGVKCCPGGYKMIARKIRELKNVTNVT